MNTHGPHDEAKAAGLPLLEAAFTSGTYAPRYTAFYLGNWLTELTNDRHKQSWRGEGTSGLRSDSLESS